MSHPALNFYVKFTPRNFKGLGSARRASAIFGSALLALQNFISAFKFYSCDLALLLKFAPQKSASVFKFSRRRFASNLRSTLRAVFAATRALFAKILSRKAPVSRNFVLLNSMPLNLTQQNLARQNSAPQILYSGNFTRQNSNSQGFARQSLGQQGCAQQSVLARQNFAPQKSARRNRTSKIAAPQNFARLNLAMPQNLLPPNSAFKFKASADV